MAFQQPTRQFTQHQRAAARVGSEDGDSVILSAHHHNQHIGAPSNESQTWVLFTPGTDSGTTASYLDSSIQDDQTTPGRSHASDLGSLGTIARSSQLGGGVLSSAVALESEEPASESAIDDEELDSLDSHLPEFRAAPNPYTGQPDDPIVAPVLPGHDGLGSFHFDAHGMISDEVQERLYAFERYNPNRVTRGLDGFTLAELEFESEEAQEMERMRRIEAWRLEQSRLLLEDIQRETRRRRMSEASAALSARQDSLPLDPEAIEKSIADEEAAAIHLGATDWHDQDAPKAVEKEEDAEEKKEGEAETSEEEEGLLSRIARKVICDLMGIDDKLLAVLFGEALPDEEMLEGTATPKISPQAIAEAQTEYDKAWQLRMLDRIARELGMLVHRMSTHSPSSYATYKRVLHQPLPYAGLPVIPETPAAAEAAKAASSSSSNAESQKQRSLDGSVASMPPFKPTITSKPNLFEETRTTSVPSESAHHSQLASDLPAFTQQEWEQDLDIKLVFRYLRSRFTSSRQTAPSFTSGTSHLATSSTQDVAAKAARVRQHHPLVSHIHHRSRTSLGSGPAGGERRSTTGGIIRPGSGSVSGRLHHHHHHHHHHYHHHHHHHGMVAGSCASQSTRRTGRRSSIASSRASSRHYWDIGGSRASGSVIASTGPMGSWGDV